MIALTVNEPTLSCLRVTHHSGNGQRWMHIDAFFDDFEVQPAVRTIKAMRLPVTLNGNICRGRELEVETRRYIGFNPERHNWGCEGETCARTHEDAQATAKALLALTKEIKHCPLFTPYGDNLQLQTYYRAPGC
jgi:hypothetical protein|tara:strand:- start:554 stop:955 length:402 start_codon:yes stop_codon:yes gene_type:complete